MTDLSATLLINNPTLPRWRHDALGRMVTETDARTTRVVPRDEAFRLDGLSDFLRNARNRFGEYPR